MDKYFKEYNIKNYKNTLNLDKYLYNHNGFIAGGYFKSILQNQTPKDIDIFFKNRDDFDVALNHFKSSGWTVKYENEKAIALKKHNEEIWIELIRCVYGTPEEILSNFDFTISKMAYYKKDVDVLQEMVNKKSFVGMKPSEEFILIGHKDFFEHLHMKMLVVDKEIPYPISTWERTYKYKSYGYNLCNKSKIKLLDALRCDDIYDEDFYIYEE